MLNVTSRLALRIRHLPPFEFDWSDTTPQRSCDTLTIKDFLPSEEDVKQRATQYIMGFLVKSFTSLSDLAKFVLQIVIGDQLTCKNMIALQLKHSVWMNVERE